MKSALMTALAITMAFLAGCGEGETPDRVGRSTTPDSAAEPDTTGQASPATTVLYYRFAEADEDPLPEGSVTVLEDMLVLVPEQVAVDGQLTPEQAISAALRVLTADQSNEWTSDDLRLRSVSLEDGHALVELEGSISGAGDIVLVAARMQILLTVFARPEVETATVTLDGECIGNLGASHESEIRPPGYRFARQETEVPL